MSRRDMFLRACEKGDKNIVSKHVKKNGKNVLKRVDSEYGQTCLHVSCEFGREDLVQYFLQDKFSGKIDVNAVDKNGWTALHCACKNGNLNIINTIIKKGAHKRLITNEGASPLHYFVRNKDNITNELHTKILKELVDGSFVDAENKHGETPLHQAAMRDRAQNVAYLIQENADPNKKTRHGETPLHFAARGNSNTSIITLLNSKANPTITSDDNISVFSIAKKWEASKIPEILIDWYTKNNIELTTEMVKDKWNQKTKEKKEKKEVTSRKPKTSIALNPTLISNLKGGWECKNCSQKFTDIPLYLFCRAPDDYDLLDGYTRLNRAKISADLCSIEDKKFYIRGLLEIPLKSSENNESEQLLTWGCWINISKDDFDKIITNWNNNETLKISGTFNNNLPVYSDTLGMPVTLTTRTNGLRPLIIIEGKDHPLSKDLSNGIELERITSLLEFVLQSEYI